MCSATVWATLQYNLPLSGPNRWICFCFFFVTTALSSVFLLKSGVCWLSGVQKPTISQASWLLFRSPYLIIALFWLGGAAGRENEETAFMAIFFPLTDCLAARDIESLSWYPYDSPYFIPFISFVLGNYYEREHRRRQTRDKRLSCPFVTSTPSSQQNLVYKWKRAQPLHRQNNRSVHVQSCVTGWERLKSVMLDSTLLYSLYKYMCTYIHI